MSSSWFRWVIGACVALFAGGALAQPLDGDYVVTGGNYQLSFQRSADGSLTGRVYTFAGDARLNIATTEDGAYANYSLEGAVHGVAVSFTENPDRLEVVFYDVDQNGAAVPGSSIMRFADRGNRAAAGGMAAALRGEWVGTFSIDDGEDGGDFRALFLDRFVLVWMTDDSGYSEVWTSLFVPVDDSRFYLIDPSCRLMVPGDCDVELMRVTELTDSAFSFALADEADDELLVRTSRHVGSSAF